MSAAIPCAPMRTEIPRRRLRQDRLTDRTRLRPRRRQIGGRYSIAHARTRNGCDAGTFSWRLSAAKLSPAEVRAMEKEGCVMISFRHFNGVFILFQRLLVEWRSEAPSQTVGVGSSRRRAL